MKTYLTIIILCVNTIASFGQIFTQTDFKKSITISPQGIINIYPTNSEVSNITLGELTLYSNTTGSKNIALGFRSLYSNTSGNQLTAVGHQTLTSNTTGLLNSAFGRGSLYANSTGNENTAVGANVMNNNTTLSRNVAVGSHTLREQSYDGGNNSDNVAIGESALFNNNPTDGTNGRQNIAVGDYALTDNKTGARNIGLGSRAGYRLLSGNDNVILGYNSLWQNRSGSKNTVLGDDALHENQSGSGNVVLGTQAGYYETGDNKLYISYVQDEKIPLIGGDFTEKKVGINRDITSTTYPNDFKNRTETLQVEGEAFKTVGNGSWNFPSDRRLKKNITALANQEMLHKVLQMQGVTYEMKDSTQKGLQYGFIAQELYEIFPSKIKKNKAGYLSADYGSYDPLIVESIKALHQKIDSLKKDNTALETTLATLVSDLDTLMTKMDKLEATTKSQYVKTHTFTEK